MGVLSFWSYTLVSEVRFRLFLTMIEYLMREIKLAVVHLDEVVIFSNYVAEHI